MRMTLRIPEELEAQLREEAIKEDRSINGQLVHILREHFDPQVITVFHPVLSGDAN